MPEIAESIMSDDENDWIESLNEIISAEYILTNIYPIPTAPVELLHLMN